MKIAITGHRPDKLNYDYDLTGALTARIQEKIELVLRDYIDKPDTTLITGMALGIDTLFALIAVELELPFIAAIPCSGQYQKWTEKSKKLYHKLINSPLCTKHYVSKLPYDNKCMDARNRWMVDNADLIIAVWNGSPGGTANCVKYARAKKKHIIYINPNEL